MKILGKVFRFAAVFLFSTLLAGIALSVVLGLVFATLMGYRNDPESRSNIKVVIAVCFVLAAIVSFFFARSWVKEDD